MRCPKLRYVDISNIVDISNSLLSESPLEGRLVLEKCKQIRGALLPQSLTEIYAPKAEDCYNVLKRDGTLSQNIETIVVKSVYRDIKLISFDYYNAQFTSLKNVVFTSDLLQQYPSSNYLPFYQAPNVTVYVKHNLVSQYQSATNWSTYSNRIKPIGGEITITNDNNTITIACSNPDASIKYMVNGGDEQEYTAPFSINEGDVVYAFAEKFGVFDGEAFVNFNADSIGGKISYVSSEDNGATYHFYRANGVEIAEWNTRMI